jgi:hypothetical protein
MTCSSSAGQTLKPPAAAGAALVASSAAYWLAVVPVRPSCVAAFLPGLILGRAGAGLAQAPLFAAASSLQADRATSGSAVLNVSRQLGSAVGVALLVALLASPQPQSLALFHRGWILEASAAAAAALVLVLLRSRRPARGSRQAVTIRTAGQLGAAQGTSAASRIGN